MVGIGAYLAQTVKNLAAMWETWAKSLGKEDSLEKRIATHSSISSVQSLNRVRLLVTP